MTVKDVLILDRSSLIEIYKAKALEDIDYVMFRVSDLKLFRRAGLVIFVDTDNSIRILKNRYGNGFSNFLFL